MSAVKDQRARARARRALQVARRQIAANHHSPAAPRSILHAARGNAAAAAFVSQTNPLDADVSLPARPCDGTCSPYDTRADHMRAQWQCAVANFQAPFIAHLAARHHQEVTRYGEQVQQQMARATRGASLYVRVPAEQLDPILALGRLGGCSDAGQWGGGKRAVRERVERLIWGQCPTCMPDDRRRLYGYVLPARRQTRDRFGLGRFGEVDLLLDTSVLARTTLTWGCVTDCTDCAFVPALTPSPYGIWDIAAYPAYAAERGFGWRGWRTTYTLRDPLAPGALSPTRHLVQAQIRGPVALRDITCAQAATWDWPADEADAVAEQVAAFNAALAERQSNQINQSGAGYGAA